jgi:hypothetical protein
MKFTLISQLKVGKMTAKPPQNSQKLSEYRFLPPLYDRFWPYKMFVISNKMQVRT